MADENGVPTRTLQAVRTRADRRWDRSQTTATLLGRLGGADFISLSALAVAWIASLLFLAGEINWAIVTTFAAAGLDKLDGYYARTYGEPTRFGRQLDSFIDVFVYLVTAALLFHYAISPQLAVSALVGFLLFAFGVLRLLRHADEGFAEDEGTTTPGHGTERDCATDADGVPESQDGVSYYLGVTVVHALVLVVANYFLLALTPVWNGWLAALTIVALCPLMVSGYKSYKSDLGHALAGLGGLLAVALALSLEFGVFGGV